MKKHLRFLTICAVAFITAGSLYAQTEKWVDQAGGNDSNDGNTALTAYATLQYAINNSSSGTSTTSSIIHVMNGTYETSGQTNQGGYATAILIQDMDYLTIHAVSGQEPKVMPGTAADIASISIQNCDYLIIDNIDSDQTIAQWDNWHVWDADFLTVRNCTFEGGKDGIDFNTGMNTALIENNTFQNITSGSDALDIDDGSYSYVTVQDNLFTNNYRHLIISSASNIIIQRNIMNGTVSEEAIRLIGASDVMVENNVIMNNEQQGVYVDAGCGNVSIQHNTFFNNDLGETGSSYGEIRTKVYTADIIIQNNIIYGNGLNPAFETSVSPLPGEDYNLVYNTSDVGTFPFGGNTITGLDPNFINIVAGSEDLHLNHGSPAIDAGANLGVLTDIELNTRVAPPDIGAYEYASTNNPPIAICQDVIVDADGNCEAVVSAEDVNNGSYDPDGDPILLDLTLEGPYPLGTTDVILTVTDDSGEIDECNATITVVDNTLPVITTIEDPITLWPPNHKYKEFDIDDFVTSVSDNCSDIDIDDIIITYATSDEPENANGDGNTIDDIVITDDCKSLKLRKERKGNGNGRVYTIHMEVDDDNGNTAIASFQVHIPHNNGGTAIDDGPDYTVYGDCGLKSGILAENDKPTFDASNTLTSYPNPFTGVTYISFSLSEQANVTLKIYNSMGQEVNTLVNGTLPEGNQEVKWNGDDYSGNTVDKGVYIYRLISGDQIFIKKVIKQ